MPRSAGGMLAASGPRPNWWRSEDWTLSRLRISPSISEVLTASSLINSMRRAFLVVGPDMAENPHELAGLQQKLLLQSLQGLGIKCEFRPIRLFPVPGHEL